MSEKILEIKDLFVQYSAGKDIVRAVNGISLTLYNPTAFDAVVTIFAEDGTQALQPLGDNAFTDWKQKVAVKAGKTKTVKL